VVADEEGYDIFGVYDLGLFTAHQTFKGIDKLGGCGPMKIIPYRFQGCTGCNA
jgi:hypothetical protein